ncbi:hypothetical protein [Cytobacillus massiliigabonensis]|uniref:hypothetical protein n=1 Tax=Cytobacillus massiliigabonensis TaxID=1871011 RepID=UPI000C848001|nr:hypothetical protein [Cytobacillus massiliigabonensis]
MKNGDISVGTKLKAKSYCGFPDGTTTGKVYEVVRTEQSAFNQRLFFIINDNGREVMPISTIFSKEASE